MILVGMRGLIVPHDFRRYHAQSKYSCIGRSNEQTFRIYGLGVEIFTFRRL